MAFGNWPVASLRQRAVYKTEFDIFKQSTDIDLISLLSYEDHTPKHFDQHTLDVRPKTVPDSKTRPCNYSKSGVTERNGYRNKTRLYSAYDPRSKINKTKPPPERVFKRSDWNRIDTGIYKAFARTSKTFLKQKHKATEQRRGIKPDRECKSALDIRKPLEDPVNRCQTTCGFRSNERDCITPGKTNTKDVPNVATANKESKLNHQVNKTERSTVKHIWRTKSAPTIVNTNKGCYLKRQEQPQGNEFVNSNKRRRSGLNVNKSEYVHETKKSCFLNQDFLCEKGAINDQEISCRINSPTVTDSSSGQCYPGAEKITCNGEDLVKSLEEKFKEWESLECIENENVTCIVEKEEENCDVFSANGKETGDNSIATVNEDGIGSKDSGFASNAVTPELDFWNKAELNEEKTKRVKFEIENRDTEEISEKGEHYSNVSENGNSDSLSEAAIEKENTASETVYDINTLITDLERVGANSRLSVISAGGQSNYTVDGDTDSLCGDAAQKALNDLREAEEKERAKIEEEKKEQKKLKDSESINMSKEARHAIMETLKDMGTTKGKGKKRENDLANIKHKGVTAQRRQTDNRSKYEFYMRERTKSVFRNQFKSMDSVGNEENSSAYSSPREVKECDDTSSEEYIRGKLFPSIRENTKLSKTTTSTNKSNVMTLDHAKKTKYKIPGIGNYHLIASPDNDFEITPPGFDSRYNPRPIISKEEMEIPPRFIRERSIEKCKSWLTNINMSPLSLRPAKRTK